MSGKEIRWEHYHLIHNLRADEMLAGLKEPDARLKMLRHTRERLLHQIADHLCRVLGENPEYIEVGE